MPTSSVAALGISILDPSFTPLSLDIHSVASLGISFLNPLVYSFSILLPCPPISAESL